MKETELAQAVAAFLTDEGWICYFEVCHQGDDRRADIVAVRGPETWVVEVKTCRSGALLTQARQWTGHANRVSVAVPSRKRAGDPQAWDYALHRAGIGEFTVDANGEVEIVRSPLRARLTDLGIRASLREEQRTFAPAGNSDGKRWSPFQQIAQDLRAAVEASPGITLLEFTGDEFKAESLRRRIKQGAVKGLVVKQGGKVFREDYQRHTMKTTQGEAE
jgi:hypothetical protein